MTTVEFVRVIKGIEFNMGTTSNINSFRKDVEVCERYGWEWFMRDVVTGRIVAHNFTEN